MKSASPRVCVVGLLDRQFAIVKSEFPSLDLTHYKEGSLTRLDGKLKSADQILVITKFISHRIWDHVPRERVRYFTGLDGLRMKCAEIAAAVAFEPSSISLPIVDMDSTRPLCDYTGLATAEPGNVLEFTRPNNIPAHVFAQNVQAAQSHYQRLCGVESECEISGGRALLRIVKPATFKPEPAPEPPVTFRLPSVEEEGREFWRAMYVQSFRLMPYASQATHTHNASAAHDAWRAASEH